jgi:phage terminase large subunit GpA-like protein
MIIGGKIKEKSEGVWLLRLGVDTLKDEFHTRLAIDKPGPGYCHWPMLINGENAAGYDEHYFEQLIAEQRILKYTKGGFAKFEWHKNRTDANEALDLRVYNRAALDYLKVRLEQIPKDIIKHFNAAAIEKVEVGLGRSILVEKKGTKHERTRDEQARRQSTMEGLSNESTEGREARRTTRDVSAKYGGVTNSF